MSKIRRLSCGPLIPFKKRATFETIISIAVDNEIWQLGREDSITGGPDCVVITINCPECGCVIGSHFLGDPECFWCKIAVTTPKAVQTEANKIARGIKIAIEKRIDLHGWQGGGVHLGTPDC